MKKTPKHDFSKPTEVDPVSQAFGSDINVMLPDYKDIPEEFRNDRNKWNKLISTWFFAGLPKEAEFIPKEGIDPKIALRHVVSCLRSWAPKHEHKTAGCAHLMSLWFEDVKIDGKTLNEQQEAERERIRKAFNRAT